MDIVRFCPHCGSRLDIPQSLVVEYWQAELALFLCYCSACQWQGEIVNQVRVVVAELDEGEDA
ncbi:MAG: hypothetical protein K6T31_04170 [Alicyclobacillus sp.]|nr:hypothetical protein [Alicyclobacillus sp.]